MSADSVFYYQKQNKSYLIKQKEMPARQQAFFISNRGVVEVAGLEPAAFSLQSCCAAIAPYPHSACLGFEPKPSP